ncbi:hypothetical protein MKZ38_006166 [Zalerion maritima]|uniref:Uncharacterized protein n=1 Tax=Zalerion maritima TaxID=339359 RepID=A0AAD5WQG8_9PEZI|nr:hypothetical protein MKZ38_006166 [Zalerion maritima]
MPISTDTAEMHYRAGEPREDTSLLESPTRDPALQACLGDALWGSRDDSCQTLNGVVGALEHYWGFYTRECRNGLYDGGRHLALRQHGDVMEIAARIRCHADRKELRELVRTKLTAAYHAGEEQLDEDELLDKSVDLVASLMLMTRFGSNPYGISGHGEIQWSKGSLGDVIGRFFGEGNVLVTETVKLEKMFTGPNLGRIGGLRIVWTDNLADHLRLSDDDQHVYIFHHASFLERQRQSCDGILPPGLAEETMQTLTLLFPSSDRKIRKWFLKLPEASSLDRRVVQCGRLKADHRKIDRFVFWRDRLVILKQAFDEAQPKTLSQWWLDRRNAVQWYTFWVALMVLVLTVVFGLIQCIEGGLQVYASFQQMGEGPGPLHGR